MAISAVWTHCPALPAEAKLLLDTLVDHRAASSLANAAIDEGRPLPAVSDDPLDAELPGHARHHDLGGESWRAAAEWRTSICPHYPAIAEAMSNAPAAERGKILWDRCLGSIALVAREEYVATIRESGTVGFALYRWLVDDAKVDPKIAKPLARAVVLGGHWLVRPSAGLRLPTVESTTTVVDGPVLELGPERIRFGDRTIVRIDAKDGLEPELSPSRIGPIVGSLHDALAEEAEKAIVFAERLGDPWPGRLLLVAHRELPWSTLRPVLVSATLAGFLRVEVVGLTLDPADPFRTLLVHDALATGDALAPSDATTVQELVDAVAARGGVPRLFP